MPQNAEPSLSVPGVLAQDSAVLSSSSAFGTPVHPLRTSKTDHFAKPSVLPVLIPPTSLRPLAFRTFTKKHGLTLTSAALQALATFIGKHCGSGWRDCGLAEQVLEEVAKSWKKNRGSMIIEGDSKELQDVLRILEESMDKGRPLAQTSFPNQKQLAHTDSDTAVPKPSLQSDFQDVNTRPNATSNAMEIDEEERCQDPRKWIRVIGAFEQPRLMYDSVKKHFEKIQKNPSLFPDPLVRTMVFRNRYNLVHQRILRNESFLAPTVQRSSVPGLQRSASSFTAGHAYTLTPIANLLGRSGSYHVLLGLLTISPTGLLAISDLSGSITLDISHALPVPKNGSWFAPGMLVIVEGVYQEEGFLEGIKLGGGGGVGGTIGGNFAASSIGGPPCERREVSIGVGEVMRRGEVNSGGGFGWVDFLGVGSERAAGTNMRVIESRFKKGDGRVGRSKIICIGELIIDDPNVLQALKNILSQYAAKPAEDMPVAFILTGNFVTHATMARGGSGGSIEYKECLDILASILSEYPTILQAAMFIFVPGDNDPWPSSFSGGAATSIPRHGIPDLFTSRIKRAFGVANNERERTPSTQLDGEAIWTSNPARLSLFGPAQEIVIFRDDFSGRLRRSAISFGPEDDELGQGEDNSMQSTLDFREINGAVASADGDQAFQDLQAARRLVKTILDQGHLSPFPLTSRPVLWDWAGSLHLYPQPTALIIVDPEAPSFAITYEGCHVMNPGRLVAEGRRNVARWVEYDISTNRGCIREVHF